MTSNISDTVNRLRAHFNTGQTKSISDRIHRLKILKQAIIDREDAIVQAFRADLNKSPEEAMMTETRVVIHEINYAITHLKKWMRPRRVNTPLSLQPATSYIHKDPLGVVLIMAPWNYPFGLMMAPLVGAIAAGNTALLKPSEISVNTSRVIRDLITQAFDPSSVAVVEGGADVA